MELKTEEVLEAVRHAPPQGYKMNELAVRLKLDGKGRHRLRRLLEELQERGDVERGPGARYRLPGAEGQADSPGKGASAGHDPARPEPSTARRPGVTGQIRVHPAGYGFVERDDGEADVFVPARFRATALDGDRVRVTTWIGHRGVEGKVEEVIARGRAKLTGVYRQMGRQIVLEPDDPRIASTYGHVALEEGDVAASDGQCVVAEITRYPEPTSQDDTGMLRARVTHVLGELDDPRTEVAKVIVCADIPDAFPEDVLAAGRRTPKELRGSDFADRIDLRDRAFLTIDPETARDFDDAIFLEERPGGWRIWVAVADVSHYVSPGGALDREARIRGCSVYLPDRAIPMLPAELSSGICSLNPEVDRCAMVVRIDVTSEGVQVDKGFCAAVIRSYARLDYPGVAAALSGDYRGARARYRQWAEALAKLSSLAKKMRERRRARGTLELDLPEAVVMLDEDDPRRVRDVRMSKSNEEIKGAYQLVEEYMLAANEAVAQFFQERGDDAIWRVHDVPDPERLEEFAHIAQAFGIHVSAEEVQAPRGMQKVLAATAGKPFERALNFMMLRSLKQATYDVVNVGHFGLASREYLHFTSPIRRYPDLVVHRLLKWHLRREGQASGGPTHAPPPPRTELAAMSAESSAHERRAMEAEREVVDMYRAFLMRDRVGEDLDGVISGVTSFGIFVEIREPFVEGLIKIEKLGDEFFEFDEHTMRLVGRRSGRAFALGDPVKVRLENVSVARRKLDFSLLEGGKVGERLPPRDRVDRRGKNGARARGKGGGGGGGGGAKRPTRKAPRGRS
jgi:ribonuclease R